MELRTLLNACGYVSKADRKENRTRFCTSSCFDPGFVIVKILPRPYHDAAVITGKRGLSWL